MSFLIFFIGGFERKPYFENISFRLPILRRSFTVVYSSWRLFTMISEIVTWECADSPLLLRQVSLQMVPLSAHHPFRLTRVIVNADVFGSCFKFYWLLYSRTTLLVQYYMIHCKQSLLTSSKLNHSGKNTFIQIYAWSVALCVCETCTIPARENRRVQAFRRGPAGGWWKSIIGLKKKTRTF